MFTAKSQITELSRKLGRNFNRENQALHQKEMIIKTMEENPVVINGHTNKEEVITGLVEFVNPDKELACCVDAKYYSLNACYLNNEGKLYCSTYSIGGVLWGGYVDGEALREYNKSCLFESGKIKCVHRPDGTKIYPVQ